MRLERMAVESGSFQDGAPTPARIFLENQWRAVSLVLDRWDQGGRTPKDPRLTYYKVRTADGREVILRYHHLFDAWAWVTV
jgi:hypothetical protein